MPSCNPLGASASSPDCVHAFGEDSGGRGAGASAAGDQEEKGFHGLQFGGSQVDVDKYEDKK